MGDRAGSLGYFLDERFEFIQTEGLVADAAYLSALRDGRAQQFLTAVGTDYFVIDRGKYWIVGLGVCRTGADTRCLGAFGRHALCFPRNAEIHEFDASRNERKVFAYRQRGFVPAAGRLSISRTPTKVRCNSAKQFVATNAEGVLRRIALAVAARTLMLWIR
jgi:hypothetical protein